MALRVSIGQYYSASSPIHALDPRVKFLGTVTYMVSCFFIDNLVALACATVFIVACVALARVPARRLLAQIRPLALFLVITSLINLFFTRTGTVLLTAGPLVVFSGGLLAAILYTARFFLLLIAGSLLMLTTTPTMLTDAVRSVFAPLERIGVPVGKAALVLSIGLRFVPTLAQEADNVVAAQTARGADLENKSAFAYARACVPLIVPLFASALRHADNLGRAMDARCYTGDTQRTSYHVLRINPARDGRAIVALIAYIALLTALHLGL